MRDLILVMMLIFQIAGALFKLYGIYAPKFDDEGIFQGYCILTILMNILMAVSVIYLLIVS